MQLRTGTYQRISTYQSINVTFHRTAPKLLEPQSPVKPTPNTLDFTRTTATPVKQPPKLLQGTAAVWRTIERFKSGEIRNDIAVKYVCHSFCCFNVC